jgi:hypothetical protein
VRSPAAPHGRSAAAALRLLISARFASDLDQRASARSTFRFDVEPKESRSELRTNILQSHQLHNIHNFILDSVVRVWFFEHR